MNIYKQKYEQALERAKGAHNSAKSDKENGVTDKITEYTIQLTEIIFPELKESEDESIKEDIISLVNEFWERIGSINPEYSSRSKMLAWLEKQDPKKHEEELEKAYKCADEVQYRKGYEDAKREIENQNEQKPTDKVEPNFNVGDTIVEKDVDECDFLTIKDIKNGKYIFTDGYCMNIDEQDGWQLVKTPTINELPNGKDYGIDSLYHAVRILEKTLGEVEGYQSNDGILEHKCAIEVVKRLYEQKPAWSEEDEPIFNELVAFLEKGEFKLQHDLTMYAHWLKSLKERYTWKPSEEQIEAFEHFVRSVGESGYASPYDNHTKLLYSLLQQLKKLKEE